MDGARSRRGILLAVLLLSGAVLVWEPKHTGLPHRFVVADERSSPSLRRPEFLRVLFIGNSFTNFSGGQALIARRLAVSASPRPARLPMFDQTTGFGVTLEWHWKHGDARERIAEGNWDYVVLQDHSEQPLIDRERFIQYAHFFNTEIHKVRAKTVLYETWPKESEPSNGLVLAEAYETLGRDLAADVVPVGRAFMAVAATQPSLKLRAPDGKHASNAGSYLAACCFYSYFYQPVARRSHAQRCAMTRVSLGLTCRRKTRACFRGSLSTPSGTWRTDNDSEPIDATRSSLSNRPLLLILIVVMVLCVVGAGILMHQHRKSVSIHRVRPIVKLEGTAATVDLGGGVTLKLVRVPGGEFMMGSAENDPDGDISETDDKKGKHKVVIQNPFYLSETEITRAQYKAVMGYDPSEFKDAARYPEVAANMALPADQVSWGDAHKWCDEVFKRTGLPVRLPTEAEWEYACRAGTQTAYSTGDKLSSDAAVFDGSTLTPPQPKPKTTAAVGTHKPNPFGLFDMHGNVSEWVEDNFHDDYTESPADGSAWKNPEKQNLHVHRGGSYNNTAPTARSAMREAGGSDTDPELRTSTIGFRVAVSAK